MYPLIRKLKRCFYYQIVELVEKPYAREQYLFQIFILIYGTIRFSILLAELFSPNNVQFAEYDYAVYMGIKYRQFYDIYLIFLVLLLEYFIFVNATVHNGLSANSYTVRWIYQMFVLGQDAYFDSQYSSAKINNLQIKRAEKLDSNLKATIPRIRDIVPAKLRNHLILLFAKLTLWYSLGTVNHRKFAQKHYVQLDPNIPVKLRLKQIQGLLLVDKLFFLVQLGILIITILIMGIIYSQVRGGMPFYGPVLFLVDYSLIFYQVYQLIYYAYFSVVGIQASSFSGIYLLKVRNEALKVALKHARKHTNTFHSGVVRFLVDYPPLCEITLKGNVELTGSVYFAFLLTNVPANVYCIWRINQKSNSFEVVALLGLIMCLQVLATWATMGPMAKFASVVKAPTQVLPAVQARLSRLILKLKVEQFYETLLSGTVAGTVGPMNTVTYGYILEFLYTYTGLLFMAFSEKTSLDNDLVKY